MTKNIFVSQFNDSRTEHLSVKSGLLLGYLFLIARSIFANTGAG